MRRLLRAPFDQVPWKSTYRSNECSKVGIGRGSGDRYSSCNCDACNGWL